MLGEGARTNEDAERYFQDYINSIYAVGKLLKNSSDIKNTLVKLLSADLKQMRMNARNLIEKEYDNKECSTRLYDIYVDILTGSNESEDWYPKQ